MKSYTVSITLSVDADSESEACEEVASIMRSATTSGLYDMMEAVCDREDLVLADDTTRHWLTQLPDGYRELALANYDKRETVSERRPASIAAALGFAFGWGSTDEGYRFWNAVWEHYLYDGRSARYLLPPLP